RLINIGGKELPGTKKGPTRRRWAIITMVTETPEMLKEVLKGGEYETKTRGTRHLPPAAPVAEGRYALVRQTDHAEFVHKLKREQSEEIEELFSLMREESFVLAVKNPDIHVKGFPKSKPDYPAEFEDHFAGRRWIPADNPDLLNYDNAQLLLIGAREEKAAEDLGINIGKRSDVLDDLNLDVPTEGLLEKEFPSLNEFRELHHGKKGVQFGAGGMKGGTKGGRKAAREAPSAAAVTKLLEGIVLPAGNEELYDYAEKNKLKLENPDPALKLIRNLPKGKFKTMADVAKAVGQAAPDEYICPACGKSFDSRSVFTRHLQTSHPEKAVSAADIEKAIAGIDFPQTRGGVLNYAGEKGVEDRVLEAIENLPDKTYHDAAEFAASYQEAVTGKPKRMRKPPSRKAVESGSAAGLAKALEGLAMPADKKAILNHAKNKNAQESVLEKVKKLPDREYHTMADVMKGLGA
ncbi:MAG: DUF2795 domain-containing protein, partial [Spirochaetia bacterium]